MSQHDLFGVYRRVYAMLKHICGQHVDKCNVLLYLWLANGWLLRRKNVFKRK
jgi:hypothetical protein